jgi:hypothetical protein
MVQSTPRSSEAERESRNSRGTATLGMALSTVSGILTRCSVGRLGRIGLEQPVRYERSSSGELVHVDVKKLGRIRGVGHTGSAATAPARPRDASTGGTPGSQAGSTSMSQSTTTAGSLTSRSSPTKSHNRDRLPAAGDRFLCPLRHHRRTRPNRQRPPLHLHDPRAQLQSTRHPSPSAPDHAAHKPTAKPNASSAR